MNPTSPPAPPQVPRHTGPEHPPPPTDARLSTSTWRLLPGLPGNVVRDGRSRVASAVSIVSTMPVVRTAHTRPGWAPLPPAPAPVPHPPATAPVSVPAPATGHHRTAFVVAAVALAVATAALRLYHQAQSYELFMDEIEYADVANSFAAGHGPQLFEQAFFLHPPLFFVYVSAFVSQAVTHPTVSFVLGLRPVVVPFAAANCLLVIAIARRLTGRRPALIAGMLYALDPFLVRFDSRLMLEAPTMTMVMLGLMGGLVAVESRGRRRILWLVGAGVAFGLAITTKSTSALITTLPLLLMTAVSGGPRRREALGMIAVQCGVYAAYVTWVISIGRFGDWFTQTTRGVLRAAIDPQTGFNAATAPTIIDRILSDLVQFGPSYLLIGAAMVAIAVLVFEDVRSRGRAGRHARSMVAAGEASVRMLTCWLAGVILSIGYTAAFGELEEQTFYLMAVPSTIVVAVVAARFPKRRGRTAIVAGIVVTLAWSVQVWTMVHTVRDDSYSRLDTWLAPAAHTGTVLALGEATAQFVSPGFGMVAIRPDGTAPGAHFALVSTQLTSLHLATVTAATIARLDRDHAVVFSAHGRSSGDLRLYDLTRTADGRPAPVTTPVLGAAPALAPMRQ